MSQQQTAIRISPQYAILSAGEAGRIGYSKFVRAEGVRIIEQYKGPIVEVAAVLALSQREIVVRDSSGESQSVPLSDIQFLHVDRAIADHLGFSQHTKKR